MINRITAVMSLLYVLLIGLTASTATAAELPQGDIAARIDSYMENFLKENEFSGVVLFSDGERIVFNKAYGLASRRFDVPNTTATRFNFASLGKLFTSLAIAQLEEQGKLSVDDPIGKYLGEEWLNEQARASITIYHLLSHTSGIRDFLGPHFFTKPFFLYRDLDDFSAVIEKETDFEPGAKMAYCNSNYLLLGVILQKVTGQDFREYFQQNIFGPAGMSGVGYFAQDDPVPNVAVGYFTGRDGAVHNNVFNKMAQGTTAGGGYATTEDFWKFAVAFRNNKLCSDATKESLITRQPNALGFDRGWPVRNRRMLAAGGITGVAAWVRLDFDSGLTIVVLSNFGPSREAFEGIGRLVDQPGGQ